ncbi:MAG TPA: lactonase family protein [Polyangiaceae bacterium]|nr:lactonase family protein [Polyangiaceae bacterium]
MRARRSYGEAVAGGVRLRACLLGLAATCWATGPSCVRSEPPSVPAAAPPAAAVPRTSQQAGPGHVIAYASGYGPDIELFAVDAATGALSHTASFPSFGPAPSYLAFDPSVGHLYALDESPQGRVGAYRIDPTTGSLTFVGAVSSGGDGPAHLSVDATGRHVLVANYGDGSVSVLPVLPDAQGGLGPPSQTLRVGAQAHMIITDPSNRFAFVPCKGADYIAQFVFDATTGELRPNQVAHVPTARGAGPRHLAFHPGGRFAYGINELDNTMTAYAFDPRAGTLSPIETQSTLPRGFAGKDTAAEVWVHPSGAWVFGSNRGDDSIVVFSVDPSSGRLTVKGHTKTGGATPRDFALDATGSLLYVCNQGSGAVDPLRFDAERGVLTAAAPPVRVASASFIGLVRLP